MRRGWVVSVALVGGCGPSPGSEASATDTTTGDPAGSSATASDGSATEEPFEPPPVMCPDQLTTGSETGKPPERCPEHLQTDACCCFDDVGKRDNTSEGTISVCGVDDLCPLIQFECVDFLIDEVNDCPSANLSTNDIAAVDCALQALIDGATGRVAWRAVSAYGFSHEDTQLDLVGDSTVFRSGDRHIDLYYEIAPVRRLSLPDSTYFADCAKAPDWHDRFDCMREALACPPLETCVDGYLLDTTQGLLPPP